jgi:hypothetical protein
MLATLKTIFRPASPTDDPALFKGREEQLSRVLGAIGELGEHAVVYGERGVGKTSLAYMAKDAFRVADPSSIAVRVPCSADDNFATVWKKLVPRLTAELDVRDPAERDALIPALDRLEDILQLEDEVTPEMVVRALHVFSAKAPLLVIVDEFDRIGDFGSTHLFSDVVKMASDDLLRATLLVVGVADDVDQLIQGHRSIERSMKQVSMPRMSTEELSTIVVGGFRAFTQRSGHALEVNPQVVTAIARLSQGFPYYTHLLSGALGELALRSGKDVITVPMVFECLLGALDEATHSIKVSYTDAVTSPKQNASFADTALACALVVGDDLGFFAPADVVAPLQGIADTAKTTGNFLSHLKRFAGPPSYLLETRGEGRATRYRFANPLMKPFVLIKGVQSGRLRLPGTETDDE